MDVWKIEVFTPRSIARWENALAAGDIN